MSCATHPFVASMMNDFHRMPSSLFRTLLMRAQNGSCNIPELGQVTLKSRLLVRHADDSANLARVCMWPPDTASTEQSVRRNEGPVPCSRCGRTRTSQAEHLTTSMPLTSSPSSLLRSSVSDSARLSSLADARTSTACHTSSSLLLLVLSLRNLPAQMHALTMDMHT